MNEGEFLTRFDKHLARTDTLIEDQRRLHDEYREERRQAQAERERDRAERERDRAEQRKVNEEHREAHALHVQEMKDVRFEMKQMSLRGERVAQSFIAVLQDLLEESRAGRQALFAILDELRGSGPSTAGA